MASKSSNNPLYEQLTMFEEDVTLCALREATGAGISGPTGLGKTYIVNKVCRKCNIKSPTPIKATPAGFKISLYHHKDDALLFFDDFDKIFSSQDLVNIVKDAVEPVFHPDGHIMNRKIVNQSDKTYMNAAKAVPNPNITPPEFWIKPAIIAATNVDVIGGITEKMRPHFDAVQSKGLRFRVLNRERDNIHDYVCDVVNANPAAFMGSLSKTEFHKIMTFFDENRYLFRFFNFRPIQEMVRDFSNPNVKDWKARQTIDFLTRESRYV
jgi:hypothetical protein